MLQIIRAILSFIFYVNSDLPKKSNFISTNYFKIVEERDLCLAHCKEPGRNCPMQYLKWVKSGACTFSGTTLRKMCQNVLMIVNINSLLI